MLISNLLKELEYASKSEAVMIKLAIALQDVKFHLERQSSYNKFVMQEIDMCLEEYYKHISSKSEKSNCEYED